MPRGGLLPDERQRRRLGRRNADVAVRQRMVRLPDQAFGLVD